MIYYFLDVECSSPGDGIDANLTSSATTFSYLDTVNYTCNNPAAMVTQGSLTLTCEGDGHWSNSQPVCGKKNMKQNRDIQEQ